MCIKLFFKVLTSFSLILNLFSSLFAENDKMKVYCYHGIPGCECFHHCSCYSQDKFSFCSSNTAFPKNVLWHAFMKKMQEARKVGPYFAGDLALNIGYFRSGDCCLLSEYFVGINMLEERMQKQKVKTIQFFEELYLLPKEKDKLNEKKLALNTQLDAAKVIFEHARSEIIDLYDKILSACPHKGSFNHALTYNEGLLALLKGDFESSIDKISELVIFSEINQSIEQSKLSEIYEKQGESLLEIGLYHEAIKSLSKALEKDSKNINAYFYRAVAYFEVGDFDSAIQDYETTKKNNNYQQIEQEVSSEFSSTLLKGILEGGKEAAVEFVPSMCNTAFGIGESLWCFAQQPVDSTINFCNSCYEIGEIFIDYIRTLDQESIEDIADEIMVLYHNFDVLSNGEKGLAIGQCIGKYGVDIFAGGATFKCVSAIKKLKNANRVCNLEALAASSSRDLVTVAALKHAVEREEFLKNVKIHWARQNKHIPDKHNYNPSRGIIKLNQLRLEEMIRNNIGKGKKANSACPFSSGYKERIDFGEVIGDFAYQSNDQALKFIPTSRGILHYSKDGVHLVPSAPIGFK